MTLAATVLEPYDPRQTCPKCGHRDISTGYWPDSSHYDCELGRRLQTSRAGEHLERTCRRCHYSWEQACTSAPDDAPALELGDVDGLLSALEVEAVELLGSFSGKLRRICGDGPVAATDYAELVAPIHVLQRTIGAQAAARAFPTRYRLLGEIIREEDDGNTSEQEQAEQPIGAREVGAVEAARGGGSEGAEAVPASDQPAHR